MYIILLISVSIKANQIVWLYWIPVHIFKGTGLKFLTFQENHATNHVYVNVCTCVPMWCVRASMYVYVYMCVCVCVCVCVCLCVHVHTCKAQEWCR